MLLKYLIAQVPINELTVPAWATTTVVFIVLLLPTASVLPLVWTGTVQMFRPARPFSLMTGRGIHFTLKPIASSRVPSGSWKVVEPKFTVTVAPLAKVVCCTLRSGVRNRWSVISL